ncbi:MULTISPECIES: aldo/keto reductase [Thioclava]|uniref:Aldo/keto reductase n=1 Tax=Thioclava nitratireducens TaxID=1915078 RepID=A0ABM6IJY0_9RHOB|nr:MULTISPECIES: aldo/keto reductase [Thioclava]AQS49260.1 aldo/keto reductase [Thioclava nitratireducens]OWY03192.1 aldo/keto reductase [Thioclava sp. IC9]OWY14531.1 aldo/keto reductase [Thioclava sp. F34-6]OWY16174.1 aldo/keto reductase [Thioclava sp. JM3]PWE51692.1 aldo/keto reductase [Thioclava sp. NG1]
MRKLELGQSGIMVSEICLGTMTWGSQNTEAEGHDQIDFALDRGINFLDTAEMYPVNPVKAETLGRTEQIVGTYLAKRGKRDDLVVATKITGEGSHAIEGGPVISPTRIRQAVTDSLTRLQTDYIDLYQFHWPNRGSYHFRKTWRFDPSKQPSKQEVLDDMSACLETLEALRQEGKIREFGLSNESAWGTAQWLALAAAGKGPRVESIQNEYSLMCRYYDLDLGELGQQEKVTLLAYSPLAAGILTGKYSGDVIPENTRRSLVNNLGGRANPRAFEIADRYVALAKEFDLHPVTMAIAWVMSRPFPVIPIVGATSVDQLKPNLDAEGVELPKELLDKIAELHKHYPMPY